MSKTLRFRVWPAAKTGIGFASMMNYLILDVCFGRVGYMIQNRE